MLPQYRIARAMLARQNDMYSRPNDSPVLPDFVLNVWKRRTSHDIPVRLVMNPTTPAPTSNTGTTFAMSNTLNVVVVLTRINPPPAAKYGRSEYSVRRCGAAITRLPVNVVTRLPRTSVLSPDSK